MQEPKPLLIVGPNGDVYAVSSYEQIKTSLEIEHGHEYFLDILKMWYTELAFTYRFDSGMQSLINMGAVKQKDSSKYELSDIHNSLNFIRSKVIHEMGNATISNLNLQVENKWKKVEKDAEQTINENKTLQKE